MDNRTRKLYKENKQMKKKLDGIEQQVMRELARIIEIYESRLAYLMATKCKNGILADAEVEAWGKDKYYSIHAVGDEEDRKWKVDVHDGKKLS